MNSNQENQLLTTNTSNLVITNETLSGKKRKISVLEINLNFKLTKRMRYN